MKKKRIIPVLLLRNGFLVQSKTFSRYQSLGNPVTSVKRLSDWAADELIYLDISTTDVYDYVWDDRAYKNRNSIMGIISDVAGFCHMPVAVGGKIRFIEDIRMRLSQGADKVTINTRALEEPAFITQAAQEFGSQCIVISIDVKLIDGKYTVMSHGGKKPTAYEPVVWARMVEELGAGEILINSIDRDGTSLGYDLDLIGPVAEAVKIPVIALGGVGEWEHLAQALEKTNVDAVAAANIFQYRDQSVYLAKKYLYERKLNVRAPDLFLRKEQSYALL